MNPTLAISPYVESGLRFRIPLVKKIMVRLLRALLPILVLASLLAGGGAAPRADRGCDGMSAAAMDDCHKAVGDHGAQSADDCTAVSCGQASPVAGSIEAFFRLPVIPVVVAIVAASDVDPTSLAGSPDLRPPIA
ncbi:hypothetical protein [Methylosinus sp. H3A]|uniref:hypothetical protein n=1 Tax=Methylosinus sp. H3A TaxID=2785786 RepID=UPI001FEF48F2|nr:hypothetical protein [Methylosinus sp. H3A]